MEINNNSHKKHIQKPLCYYCGLVTVSILNVLPLSGPTRLQPQRAFQLRLGLFAFDGFGGGN
jgi:hypothetical protein